MKLSREQLIEAIIEIRASHDSPFGVEHDDLWREQARFRYSKYTDKELRLLHNRLKDLP